MLCSTLSDASWILVITGMVSAIAMLGDVLTGSKKESNDWKARMLKAGYSDLSMPDDWDTLSEDEKEKRLNKSTEFGNQK